MWIHNLRSQNCIPWHPWWGLFSTLHTSNLYLGKSCLASVKQQEMVCLPKQSLETEIKDPKGPLLLPTFRGLLRLSEGRNQLPRKAFRVQLRAMKCWKIFNKNQSPKPALNVKILDTVGNIFCQILLVMFGVYLGLLHQKSLALFWSRKVYKTPQVYPK